MSLSADEPTFASLLRALRLQRGLSQRTLAVAAGLSKNTVSAYELGRTVPRTAAELEDLIDALRLDPPQGEALREARARFLHAQALLAQVGDASASPQLVQNVRIGGTVHTVATYLGQIIDGCRRMGLMPMLGLQGDNDPPTLSTAGDLYVGVYLISADDTLIGADAATAAQEYDAVVARKMPRLIVVAEHGAASFPEPDLSGQDAAEWRRLRDRLDRENDVKRVNTPEALRNVVVTALAPFRRHNDPDNTRAIPDRPVPYVAHPYLLLQTKQLLGRAAELKQLDAWIGQPVDGADTPRVLSIVAVGGMGKSALTWTWFTKVTSATPPLMAGAVWWSFYERDAHFDAFVLRTLAYATGTSVEAITREIPADQRDNLLLELLDQAPFLIVLDGLERLLLAYARMDAARLADDDLDGRTANAFPGRAAGGAPPAVDVRHRLRRAIDPRVGRFLRGLTRVRASRVLISTRLLPADLQTGTGRPLPGSDAVFLQGLRGLDSLALWRALGGRGASDRLLPLFDSVAHHPLLIQALAGTVARYRQAPGDFDSWRRGHPDFDPFGLPIAERTTHILAYALDSLDGPTRTVLEMTAAFRTPVRYAALANRFVGTRKLFRSDSGLDHTLTDLEDRGLLGWDTGANRYDLHPVVRGVVWTTTDGRRRQDAYEALHAYYGARARLDDWQQVNALDDLADTIELYYALAGLDRFDEAWELFSGQLGNALLYRLSANRERAELLEQLFPDGLDQPPHLSEEFAQVYTCSALVQSYAESGQCGQAAEFFQNHQDTDSSEIGMINPGDVLWPTGQLFAADIEARNALFDSRELELLFHEALSLRLCGLILAICGDNDTAQRALERAAAIFADEAAPQFEGVTYTYLAQHAIWRDQYDRAAVFVERAAELAQVERQERDLTRAHRLMGTVALGRGELTVAAGHLEQALARAREKQIVEEEILTLIALATLHYHQGEPDTAQALLEDVWEPAERGPYPLYHADALLLLAQIARDAGDRNAAEAAAIQAYRLAWCDGPPYSYHWGLQQARALLATLGLPEPELPPFDTSRTGALPLVEIDPVEE